MNPNKNMIRVCVVLAVVLTAFCVVAFTLPLERNGVFWFALVMGVIAVAVQVYATYTASARGEKAKSKFYGWPITQVGTMYMRAQLTLSIVFMLMARAMPLWVAVAICAVLLGIALAGLVTTDAPRDEIERQDEEPKEDESAMRDIQSRARAMAGRMDGEAGKALEELSDKLLFSDPVSSDALAEIEAELAACMDTLQQAVADGDRDAVLTLCRKAGLTLDERNRLCRLNKENGQ
ncbi:MAG: hypothetical protein II458_09740 [Oscillospiraceae bacterium]|nr:hypothetical protein [Oscillospiraceae bacterium]